MGIKIQVLGTGCPKCQKLTAHAQAAAEQAGIDYELQKVTNINEIIGFGVMTTPALVIDKKVLVSGRVASVDEIRGFITPEEG